MNVFDLFAKISLDTKEYESSLQDAEKKTSSFSSSIGGGIKKAAKVGTAAVGVITAASSLAAGKIYNNAKATAAYGDTVDKMSQKVGMSAEAYQEWDYVMNISGTEMSNMTTGLKTLTNKFDEAKSGTKASVEMFEKLGLKLEDIKGLSREDLFSTVISQFQQMEDSTERAALANDLFGRSGQELMPLFNTTVEETQKLIKESREYGAVLSNDAVKASAKFNDRLTRMRSAMSGVKNTISSDFLPGLTSIVEGLADVISGNDDATEALSKGFEETIDSVADKLPKLLEVGGRIVSSLADGIIKNIPKFAKTGLNIVLKLADYTIKALPKIADAGVKIIGEIATGLSDALPELIPKAAEAVVTIAQGIVQNAPKLIQSGVELFKGLVKGLAQAIPYIIREIPNLVKELITAIGDDFGTIAGELLPAVFALGIGKALVNGITSAAGTSGLKEAVKILFTGPTGLMTAVAGGILLLGVAVKDSFDEAYETARESAAKLTDSQQKIVDSINEEEEKWEGIKESRLEAAKNIDDTIGSYKDLWDRLQQIVDKQGKVKKGYEEEAEFITGELKEALGIEIGIVDGQIKKYDELKQNIDTVIAKKKAEMYLKAYEEDYTKAVKERAKAESDKKSIYEELTKAHSERAQAEVNVAKIQEKINRLDQDGMKGTYDYQNAYDALQRELRAAEGTLAGYTERIETLQGEYSTATSNLREYDRTTANYDRTLSAVANGSVKDMEDAMYIMSHSIKTAADSSERELREQAEAFYKNYEEMTETVKREGSEQAKASQKNAKAALDVAVKELAKLAPAAASKYKDAIKAVESYESSWRKVGQNSAEGLALGFKKGSYLIIDAAKRSVKDALNTAKKVARIESPSKLFRDEVGLNLGKGIAVGLEEAEPEVQEATTNLIDAAADTGDFEYETTAVNTGEQETGSIVINVYGAEGQDINALADEIAARLQRMYRREVAKFA